MINYHFDKKENVLLVKFEGEVRLEEVYRYIVEIRENKDVPQKLKILSLAEGSQFAQRLGKKELLGLLEENKKSLARRDYIYDAFVVSGPFETALGIYYRELNKIENYRFNVFSTKEAALKWLRTL